MMAILRASRVAAMVAPLKAIRLRSTKSDVFIVEGV